SRCCRGLALCCLAFWLVGLLSGCGPRPPKPIVEQALAYQMSHLPAEVASLVGSEQLLGRVELQQVKIRQDRRQPLLLASGEKVEGHHLRGTYSISVQVPGFRRPYRRQGDPFQLTLAHRKERSQGPQTLPEQWLLAYPLPDSETWETVDFLLQPALLPEIPPVETAEETPERADPEAVSPAILPTGDAG
ncbi:MAG: hypothetical protein Q6K80_09220, partial [Thermostichus sp. DG_1_6_bins_120]